ncbi:MAG TPA: FG-GAP-like repeat-containing protein [Polyangiaceae bacterium]|nr:FG-GAP-like repeat-containing protein [Polyangiaceae bacterium]
MRFSVRDVGRSNYALLLAGHTATLALLIACDKHADSVSTSSSLADAAQPPNTPANAHDADNEASSSESEPSGSATQPGANASEAGVPAPAHSPTPATGSPGSPAAPNPNHDQTDSGASTTNAGPSANPPGPVGPGPMTPSTASSADAGPSCNPNDSLECPCPAGQLRCDGVCTDPLTDAKHCGASDGCELSETPGVACQPLNAVCAEGACMPCAADLVACANTCIDPASDQLFCGAAAGCSPEEHTRGDRCANPELCVASACLECLVFTARSAGLSAHAEPQLAFGDVTSDLLPDVVAVTADESGIVVIAGNGSPTTVSDPVSQPLGQELVALGMGRLDDDQNLDLLVGDRSLDQVQVVLGNGDGSFEAGASYAINGGPSQIVLGDFDGNQTLDALVVAEDANELSVLLNAGDGSFTSTEPITGEKQLRAAAVGDINGDGNLDAVAVGLADTVMVLIGDGDGGFEQSSHPTDGYCSAALLVDLDGDEILDLVTTPTLSGYNVEVSIGNGDGTFQDRHRLNASFSTDAVGGMPNSISAADFDFDGQLDLVVGMESGITILWGHQNWAADNRRSVTEYSEFQGVLAADYNGDGVTDIITALYNTNQDFRVYFGSVPDGCPAHP